MLEMEMTDTPRTDANYVCLYGDGIGQWVPREFACELERELAEKTRLLVEAREEGRQAGLREAKEIINNLTKNRTKEDFYPDAYDCRDAITRAAEGKNPPKEIDPNKWAFDRGLESY
jgi:hypothetical protein